MAVLEEGACDLHTPGKVHMCGGQWERGLWCSTLGVMVVKVQGRLVGNLCAPLSPMCKNWETWTSLLEFT